MAVSAGIAGCLLAMALNFGMVTQMVDTAIATDLGHLQVHAPGFDENPELALRLADGGKAAARALERLPDVRAYAPRVRAQGLVHSTRASVGVRIVAIEPAREAEVSLLADSLVEGSWLGETPRQALIGVALARRLQVGVGGKIVVSVQDVAGDLTGQAYRVAGLFRTPSLELDQSSVFLRLEEGQHLLGLGAAVSEIVVIAKRRRAIPALKAALMSELGEGAEVRTWEELQPVLVYLVESFDVQAWWVYGAVFIAMAFGIAYVLLMAIYERTREIGMLMAIGMKRLPIVAMVVTESLMVTLLGLAIGLAIALVGVFALRDGIDLSAFTEGLTTYGIGTRIVPILRPQDFSVPLAVAIAVAVLASLWPAVRAARTVPAEALRHV